jgi:[ribosomal protein S5]-alanine N-acetyltransferase
VKHSGFYFPSNFPILETERLILRQCNTSYSLPFFEMRRNSELMKLLDKNTVKDMSESDEVLLNYERAFQNRTALDWAITLRSNNTFIGTAGYHHISTENCRAEIGYVLMFEWHKMGIASEAMCAILDYGFTKMNLHSVYADVNPKNISSQKLLDKFGFLKEAHLQQNLKFNDTYLDSYIYGLLNPNH